MEYYEVLNLKKDASESDIKKAYYKLAREFHPDKVDSDKREEATKKFQKIGEAYEVLSDNEKRQIYDQHGKEGLQQGGGTNHNPFDMFSQMFGGNFGGFNFQHQTQNKQRNTKNKPTVFPINISLTDVYKGMEKKLKVTRKVIVNKETKGKVDVKDYEKTWKMCDKCRGQGIMMEMRQVNAGMFTQTQRACESCTQKGFNLLPEYDMDEISEIITVICEKGIENNTQIMFSNLGNASPGYLPGDLIVVVQSPFEEKGFYRDGKNLIYKKEIKLVDALCGVNFVIKALDDRNITVKYEDVITPTERRTIPKEGINGANLIIIFDVLFPEKIESGSKGKLRKLL